MFEQYKHSKMIAVLVIILILASILIAFLPHSHEGIDSDCPICAIIENSHSIFTAFCLLTVFYQLINKYHLFEINYNLSSTRDNTLIGLKVLLLN